MKELIKKRMPRLFKYLHEARELYYKFLVFISPRLFIKVWYKHCFGKRINLKSPEGICEKINWMKLYSDMSLWTLCADKVAVRQYVKQHGLDFTLNDVYGVFEDANEIDFDTLPNEFVLKTNNGGGGNNVIIVEDKQKLDVPDAIRKLNKWKAKKIGNRYYEPHYNSIHPRIIVEKLLKPNAGELSLTDIKIYCINGKAHSVFFCSDRVFGEKVCYSVYDLNWNLHPEFIEPEYRAKKIYPRPKSLMKMIEYSEKLSAEIPFVRVDWYEIGGQPIFSELTFTPAGGFMRFHSKEYLYDMGRQLKLPEPIKKV